MTKYSPVFGQVQTQLVIEIMMIKLPGHGGELQSSVSSASPLQLEPPYAGGGLSQERRLVLMPLPQTGQSALHSDHADQLPSTEIIIQQCLNVTRTLVQCKVR